MIDPTLNARLQTLKDDLLRVKDLELPDVGTDCWVALKSSQFEPGTDRFVHQGLARAMRDQADRQLEAIEMITRDLQSVEGATPDGQRKVRLKAWRRYTEAQKECQEFFGDCLAFMGGLNFRSMNVTGIEDQVYCVADALVRESTARAVTGVSQWSPTMPFLPETMIRTSARVAGLRFHEWSIWMLPFAIHELGHILCREVDFLRTFVGQKTDGINDRWEKARAERQIYQFLADAFATYNLGPAYPCALLHLGLNPLSTEDNTADSDQMEDVIADLRALAKNSHCTVVQRKALDTALNYLQRDLRSVSAKRALTVLKFLELMGDQPGIEKTTTDVRQQLTATWEGLVTELDPDTIRLTNQEQLDMKDLIGQIWSYFGSKFTKTTARYSYDPRSAYGWSIAHRWSGIWKDGLRRNESELPIPENIGAQSKIADLLNAAWLCRLEYFDDANTRSIAEAAYKLARVIMARHHTETSPGSPLERQKV